MFSLADKNSPVDYVEDKKEGWKYNSTVEIHPEKNVYIFALHNWGWI